MALIFFFIFAFFYLVAKDTFGIDILEMRPCGFIFDCVISACVVLFVFAYFFDQQR